MTRFSISRSRRRFVAAGAIVALLAAGAAALAVGAGGGAQDDAPANRAAIEKIVRDYILANPEILPEAMERLKEKRLAEAYAANRKPMETPYAGAWEGAADGDVVLVEFFDYACGYCRASLPDIARLLAEDARLKVVYRELPILSDESGLAARVSLMAAKQGRYMAFHRAMFAAGGVDRARILAAAGRAGLDRGAATAAIGDAGYDGEIAANVQLAQTLQATGTPLFVVNGRILAGAVGYETLKDAIAKARAKG